MDWLRMRAPAVGFFTAVAIGGAACTPDPIIEERPIVVYAPRACPVSQSDAFSVIYGHGDFDLPAAKAAISSLWLRDVGTELPALPGNTRSLIVDVSLPGVLENVDWRGTAEVPPSGPINVLVWPGGESCRLNRDVQRRTDGAIGVFGRHFMVVGGRLLGGAQVPSTWVGDLSTGIIEDLKLGLGTRRARATVTEFRSSPDQDPAPALVAGGED
ncbi:MAG: hypothetical protein KF819_30935, partial [Labilithrix sp.]|nr:hypothetical protein [Labilithrix sp.]